MAFGVRAFSLDAQSLWRDEVDALRFATVPWSEMFSSFTRPGWNGPFYFLLLRGWVALTGTSAYAMRFLSLWFGVLGVPLIYVLGHRLLDWRAGLLAALLVAASPYLTWYGQEVKMYTLLPALALVAVYGLQRAIDESFSGLSRSRVLDLLRRGYWWAVVVVATSLAFYSHILAALLVPVEVLLYFAWWPRARRRWIGALSSLACLTLPYLPLAAWQAPLVLQERQTGFPFYPLGNMVAVLLDGWSIGIFGAGGWGWPWGMVLMCALALWGLASAAFVVDRARERIALLAWLVVPVLAVWLISLRQPLFTDRYLVWAAPAFYLLVASGMAYFWRSRCWGWGRWTTVFLIGALLFFDSLGQVQQVVLPLKADLRAAVAYVADYRAAEQSRMSSASNGVGAERAHRLYLPLVVVERLPRDELIVFQIPHGRHAFDYYFPGSEYAWADGLYTNHRAPDGVYLMSEEQAARQMAQMTADYKVVWLFATEASMWDERGLVKAWLDGNLQMVDEAHFTRVDVYRYGKRSE
jgi:hypothetical protein